MFQATAAPDFTRQFLAFVQQQARTLRAGDAPPASLDEWQSRRKNLRASLIESWGGFPKEPCPLDPRVVGELTRDGYRVEKLVFQTRPGVLMTANAYVPDGEGRRATVLCVHGHWRGAKQDPVVQARCIGLVKLGFFVLCVDAFGAGERAIGKALGEYHGEMVAATLWPAGLALAGLQVYENMRAVDYLQTRPEVDGERIGVTGASGGGNQTMYAGAIDERLKCVVPVCSVGTYQAYLGAACCMCEVTPSALSYTEEAGVLALVAPRGLMLVSATRDGFQFSVGEAKKSLAAAMPVFELYGKPDHARHAIFESPHDYSRPMREAMYGWMTKHLKGEGDGSPISEPEMKTEEPETLRCFPGESRPDGFITVPQFAAAEARLLLKRRSIPDHIERWQAEEMAMRSSLPRVLGGFPRRTPLEAKAAPRDKDGVQTIEFSPEPGVTVLAERLTAEGTVRGLAVLLDLDAGRGAAKSDLAVSLRRSGWDVVTADLRATGATALASDKIGRAADHNSAEWSMWIGRPLLGQWVWDVIRLLDTLKEQAGGRPDLTAVIGVGPAGLIALCTAAVDPGVHRVAIVNALASYVTETPYEGQRLGIMVPGILRHTGDVPHIAALTSPRRLVIAGGVRGAGSSLTVDELQANYAWTQTAFQLERAPGELRILGETEPQAVVDALTA